MICPIHDIPITIRKLGKNREMSFCRKCSEEEYGKYTYATQLNTEVIESHEDCAESMG